MICEYGKIIMKLLFGVWGLYCAWVHSELITGLSLVFIWTITSVHCKLPKDNHQDPMLHEKPNLNHKSCFISQLQEAKIGLCLNLRVAMVSKFGFMLMTNICLGWALGGIHCFPWILEGAKVFLSSCDCNTFPRNTNSNLMSCKLMFFHSLLIRNMHMGDLVLHVSKPACCS